MNQQQFITIGLGGAGTRVAETLWHSYAFDHSIGKDGIRKIRDNYHDNLDDPHSVFRESKAGIFKANGIFLDSDGPDLNHVRKSEIKILFDDSATIGGPESSGSLPLETKRTWEKNLKVRMEDEIRKMVEELDFFRGVNSVCGFGGGFGSIIMGAFDNDFE